MSGATCKIQWKSVPQTDYSAPTVRKKKRQLKALFKMADARLRPEPSSPKRGLRGRGCKFCPKGCALCNYRSFHRGIGWSYVAWIYLVECSVLKIAVSFADDLSEEDLPGAFLVGRNPSELNNDGLRSWLKCKGDKCKGLKTTGLNKPTTSLEGEYLNRLAQKGRRFHLKM